MFIAPFASNNECTVSAWGNPDEKDQNLSYSYLHVFSVSRYSLFKQENSLSCKTARKTIYVDRNWDKMVHKTLFTIFYQSNYYAAVHFQVYKGFSRIYSVSKLEKN